MIGKFDEMVLNALAESLNISESAYEAAARRYYDLGNWLRDESKAKSAQYMPRISPQGSFRLGTVIKPLKGEHYDLDLSCNLQESIRTWTHTQEQVKALLGEDLKAYREERGILEPLEEKHRCWRINYQDQLKFHKDTVPCIPHTDSIRKAIQQRMIQAGVSDLLAQDVARLAVAITDDRHPSFRSISDDWQISNPEGYALWFESRMKLADSLLKSRALQANRARVEDLPAYRWKTPLQAAIQILKRHRDVMFALDPERKPISIIITTLAAEAYRGEVELSPALSQILSNMSVRVSRPRVPNPVNPVEDFADRWGTLEGRQLRLDDNFFAWLEKVKGDIRKISSATNRSALQSLVGKSFGVTLGDDVLSSILAAAPSETVFPAVHVIRDAPKPWRR